MTRRFWTDADRDALRTLYPSHTAEECAAALHRSVGSIHNQVNLLGLRKSTEWIAERARARSLQADHGGRAHRFAPGIVPWNKGMDHPSRGRSAETQFKPGRPPHEAPNYRPIGSLRLSKDGYLERKITDDQSCVAVRRWVAVHRLVWEAARGPIPSEHIVAFRPGERTAVESEITLDRLELITRAENMRRNTLYNYPPAIASTLLLIGKARALIRKRETNVTHD